MTRAVPRHVTARRMWALIFGLVVLHELTCAEGELLSEEVDRMLDKYPLATYAFTFLTVAHLLNRLPPAIDPYRAIGIYRMKGTKE